MIRKHFVLAMASSPPVPLDEINHVWNLQEMFRFAQHDKWNLWRCDFNRTFDV